MKTKKSIGQGNPTDKSRVFMTVLSNDKYIPGVKALKKSLQKVKSKYDLVVLIPSDIEEHLRKLLEAEGIPDGYCHITVQPPLPPPRMS